MGYFFEGIEKRAKRKAKPRKSPVAAKAVRRIGSTATVRNWNALERINVLFPDVSEESARRIVARIIGAESQDDR